MPTISSGKGRAARRETQRMAARGPTNAVRDSYRNMNRKRVGRTLLKAAGGAPKSGKPPRSGRQFPGSRKSAGSGRRAKRTY